MDKQAISKRLIELRGSRSREEVAKAIGVSTSTIQMYENGERVPRDELKIALANYFGTSVEDLFFAF